MSQRILDQVNNVLTTADATQTTTLTYAIPSGASFYAEIVAVGRNTSTGDTVVAKKAQGGRNVAGTVTLISSIVNIVTLAADVSLSTAAFTMVASSGNLLVKVTGVVATNIEWFTQLTISIN